MPAFQADTDQMTQIAARLTGIVNSLNSEAHSGFDASSLGHPDAVSGLHNFVSNWSHGRSEISAGVTTAQRNLNGSAKNYKHTETTNVTQVDAVDKAIGL